MTTTAVVPKVPSGSNAVEFAASLATKPDYAPDTLAALEAERAKLVEFTQHPLGVEDQTPVMLRLSVLGREVERLKSQKRVLAFDPECQILDPSVFRFRDAEGLPQLMPFLPYAPRAGFACVRSLDLSPFACAFEKAGVDMTHIDAAPRLSRCRMFPNIPSIVGYYDDVAAAAIKKTELPAFRLEAKFGGLIPPEIKVRISAAINSCLFRNVFILAEVKNWQVDTLNLSQELEDPLVVCFDGYQYWLRDAFFTTNLEQLVRNEYATKPTQ